MGRAGVYLREGMSALNSASTLAEIKAAYADNASYSEDGSVAKAKSFITACRLWLMKIPRRVARGGPASEEVEMEPRLLIDQIQEAKRYVVCNAQHEATMYSDFTNFRD